MSVDRRLLRVAVWAGSLVLVAMAGSVPAAGQSGAGVQQTLDAIETDRARLDARDAADRRLAVESVLSRCAALIADHPGHPGRPWWRLDQAEDLMLHRLPLDGTAVTVLFGLPTTSQRRLAREVGDEVTGLAREAAAGLDAEVRSLQSDPSVDDVERRARQRRITDERELRLNLFRGMADVVIASADDELPRSRRDELHARAAAALTPLAARLDGPIAGRCAVYAGVAALGAGDRANALTLFAGVTAVDGTHRRDFFSAEVGQVLAGSTDSQRVRSDLLTLQRRYDDPAEVFYRLILADQLFLQTVGPITADRGDTARLAEAVAGYERLLADTDPSRIDAVRAAILDKLAPIVRAAGSDSALPVLLRVARGRSLADAGQHQAAVVALEAALAGDQASGAVEAVALLDLGRALYASGRPDEAAGRWAELARRHPNDAQAGRAIELAASVAATQCEATPGDADRERRLREILEMLLERFPGLPSVDRWRLLAGERALEEGRLEEARRHLDRVTRDAEQWIDAECMTLRVLKMQWDDAGPAQRRELSMAVIEQQRRVAQLLDETLSEGVSGPRSDALRTLAARGRQSAAEVLLDEGRADLVIETLGPIDEVVATPMAVIADDIRLRVRTARQTDDFEVVVADLRRLGNLAPGPAKGVMWLIVRETLAEVNDLLGESRTELADDLSRRELEPLAEMMARAIKSTQEDVAPEMVRTLAHARRVTGRFEEALVLYERLLSDGPDRLPDLLGKAECLYGRGGNDDLAEAIVIYKRIAALGPTQAGEAYWQSQLRTLQILDRVDRNTRRIAPQIDRLRRLDPELGGERWRRQFDALGRKHG